MNYDKLLDVLKKAGLFLLMENRTSQWQKDKGSISNKWSQGKT